MHRTALHGLLEATKPNFFFPPLDLNIARWLLQDDALISCVVFVFVFLKSFVFEFLAFVFNSRNVSLGLSVGRSTILVQIQKSRQLFDGMLYKE